MRFWSTIVRTFVVAISGFPVRDGPVYEVLSIRTFVVAIPSPMWALLR